MKVISNASADPVSDRLLITDYRLLAFVREPPNRDANHSHKTSGPCVDALPMFALAVYSGVEVASIELEGFRVPGAGIN
jgi:hypothetical protein